MKIIGVLAFQGGVEEHINIIRNLGHKAVEVRTMEDFMRCDALILPGGESTTIGFFLTHTGLMGAIQKAAAEGMPLWGTCAGAILLAKHIESEIVPPHLGLMDITIKRNAYGRQISSFDATFDIPFLGIEKVQAAFIRAPLITKVEGDATILATLGDEIIFVQQKKILASTFHPELRSETRIHQYFFSLI